MKNYFTKKEQIVILVLALLIIFTMGFKFFQKRDNQFKGLQIENSQIKSNKESDISKEVLEDNTEIMIHISGEVYNPGVIVLESGQRLIDAVELSGGLKKQADLDKINLAKKLQDEDKIYIPKIGEEINIDEAITIGGQKESDNKKININRCNREQLVSLPGIGDATAEKILDYRNGNSFKKIEDIMNVSGIGKKKFLSIEKLITVK